MAGGGGRLRNDQRRQFSNPGNAQNLPPYNPNRVLNYDELGQSLRKAVQFGNGDYENIQEIQRLLNAGADVSKTDNYWYSPLHHAAENNHPSIILKLLQLGAPLSQDNVDF